jgi:hypothetical protein
MVGFGISYKFLSSLNVWSRGTNTFSKAHHCANTNVMPNCQCQRFASRCHGGLPTYPRTWLATHPLWQRTAPTHLPTRAGITRYWRHFGLHSLAFQIKCSQGKRNKTKAPTALGHFKLLPYQVLLPKVRS